MRYENNMKIHCEMRCCQPVACRGGWGCEGCKNKNLIKKK